ncbi:hypothetical protein, partial [Salinispira pacifica]
DIRRAASRSGRGLNGETTGESDLPAGPDFSTAESIGSQCVIAGDYRVVGGAILVHAALYDTRTHLVKTSTLFKGVAGTEIFSSIDTMSDRFSNAVRKVLPDVGQQVVEQRSLDSDTVSFDQRVADQAVIALRNRRRYAVEIIALQDDVFDSVARPTDGKLELRDYGPEVGAAVGFETVVAGQFSLAARAGVVTSIGANVERLITVPILFGPVVTFPTPHSDIFTGISASVRYCSRATVRFHDDSTAQYGPYWAFGANLDLGLRTYLNRRLSGLSDFLVYGLSFGLLGLRTDIDLSNPSPYAMALQLFLGWGTRL